MIVTGHKLCVILDSHGVLLLLLVGIGVNESVADFLLVRRGLDLSVAASLVILTRLFTVWFATIMGIIYSYGFEPKIHS